MDNVAKIGKQVQGGLPIVGLLSRLTSPEGGFDDQVRTRIPCFGRVSVATTARLERYSASANAAAICCAGATCACNAQRRLPGCG